MRGAIALVERRVIRRSALGSALIIAVVALSSGAVMALVAGGRRAATSYDRLIEWSDGGDVGTTSMFVDNSEQADQLLSTLEGLPSVEESARVINLGHEVTRDGATLPFLTPIALAEEHLIGRAKFLDGRMPDLAAVDEALLPFDTAQRYDLSVGDELAVVFYEPETDPPVVAASEPVRVTGIVASPGEFPSVSGEPRATILLTPAFFDAHVEFVDWTNGGVGLRLREGADAADLQAIVDEQGLALGPLGSVSEQAGGVRTLMRMEAGVLWLLAGVVAVGATVVLVQLLRREASAASTELATLTSLGVTRRDVALAGARRGLGVGAAGALLAATMAVAASPLFPRGLARIAEPHEGVHVDWVVLGIGAAVSVVATALVGALAARFALQRRSTLVRPPLMSSLTTKLRPTTATGVRLAVTPAPGTSSRRLGLAGIAAVLTLLVALVSLLASFASVLDEPRLSGSAWDASYHYDDAASLDAAEGAFAADPDVAAYVRGEWWPLLVDGRRIFSVHVEPSDTVKVSTDRGRAPIGPDEIALGEAEMDALGVGIGDTVDVELDAYFWGEIDSNTLPARVVGRSVLSSPLYEDLRQGEGGAITTEFGRRLATNDDFAPLTVFVRLHEGAELHETTDAIATRVSPSFYFARANRSGAASLSGLRDLPVLVAVVLAVLAVAALVHRLVAYGAMQRRQLAVLRACGFTGGQVVRAGATQGAMVLFLALVVAVPVGVLLALISWRRLADYLVVVPRPEIATTTTVVLSLVGLLVGLAIGAIVTGAHRRTPPGVALRTE